MAHTTASIRLLITPVVRESDGAACVLWTVQSVRTGKVITSGVDVGGDE